MAASDVPGNLPPELEDLHDPDAEPERGMGAGHEAAIPEWLNLSAVKGAVLSWAPAFIAPTLWAYASMPDQLAWTNQVTGRLFSLVSPIYGEFTSTSGYGEALELALLDLRGSPQRILDLATGTGFVARRLKRRYPNSEVVGVDLSAQMVATARREAAAESLEITFEVADAAQLPFEAASFDLVVSQNAPPYCGEMLRILRPRGKALLVYSFGGPWVELGFKPVAARLERSGASSVKGRRAGFGFYGLARKRG